MRVEITFERPDRTGGRWSRLTKRGAIAVALSVAVLGAAGGVAIATIPDAATGVFHGCVNKTSGSLRVVDPSQSQSCTAKELAVVWNQGLNYRGLWTSAGNYAVHDVVTYKGSSYVANVASTDVVPTNATAWSLLAAQGTNGNTILNGTTPPPFLSGTDAGDFYLDTSSDVLYGPAVVKCTPPPVKPKVCTTTWGSGVNLIGPTGPEGPAGPAGQGIVYDTYAPGEAGVPSNGANGRILTQTIAAGGDFQVEANMVLTSPGGGKFSEWNCNLVAGNPGGPTIILDASSAFSNAGSTPLSLQGVVSLAPGGFIGIECGEANFSSTSEVGLVRIDSTQVANFVSG
jgi:hypothetical protein